MVTDNIECPYAYLTHFIRGNVPLMGAHSLNVAILGNYSKSPTIGVLQFKKKQFYKMLNIICKTFYRRYDI
jgi:hypothetical protein